MLQIVTLPGDCCASLAKEYGFHDASALYNAPQNQSLKKSHENMHILSADTDVCIPDKKVKSKPLKVAQYNRFVVKGVITEFIASLADFGGTAIANKDYELTIKGIKYQGKLDSAGQLKVKIDATACSGELIIYLDNARKNNLFWTLSFGALESLAEVSGIQARLNNLGYECHNEDGVLDATTKAAISHFKREKGLAPNDQPDQTLMIKLYSEYGF